MDIGFRGKKTKGGDAAQTHSLSITETLPLRKPPVVTDEGRVSLHRQSIIKCVPQASDRVCHLNICTGIGLLFSFVSIQMATVWSLRGGSRWTRHVRPPRAQGLRTADAASAASLALAASGRGRQGGRFNDRCSVSLSSRRGSVLSVLALVPACSRSASAG